MVLTAPDGRQDLITYERPLPPTALARAKPCCPDIGCWSLVYGGTPGAPERRAPAARLLLLADAPRLAVCGGGVPPRVAAPARDRRGAVIQHDRAAHADGCAPRRHHVCSATMSRLAPLIEDLSAGRRDATSAAHKKRWGQFFTARLALRMAAMAHAPQHPLRILDPGAGTGMLGLVASESLLARGVPAVELVCMESEAGSLGALPRRSTTRGSYGPGFRAEVMARDVPRPAQHLSAPSTSSSPTRHTSRCLPSIPPAATPPTPTPGSWMSQRTCSETAASWCSSCPKLHLEGLLPKFRRRFHAGLSLARVHVFGRRDHVPARPRAPGDCGGELPACTSPAP